ncbi:DUF1836 domain-containing protein [Phosphitispora sp. TUW77]|uniref:DUF1836 domain-containing protein n=1 Tax=Phosphitispora sp. TUW77 TaxID=3152361 RepID=UPI003AB68A41
MFTKESLEKLVQEISHPGEIGIADIPDVSLYMEQLTSIIENKMENFKRHPEDKILTKTMINNYTKAGLLMPPQNKKYSKEHIILLILTYHLKNIISITDIRALFRPILNNLASREDDVISLEEIYATFLELKKIEFDSFYDSLIEKFTVIKEKTRSIDIDNREMAELFLIVVMLIAQSNAQKRLAEKIIDTYFKVETESR